MVDGTSTQTLEEDLNLGIVEDATIDCDWSIDKSRTTRINQFVIIQQILRT